MEWVIAAAGIAISVFGAIATLALKNSEAWERFFRAVIPTAVSAFSCGASLSIGIAFGIAQPKIAYAVLPYLAGIGAAAGGLLLAIAFSDHIAGGPK